MVSFERFCRTLQSHFSEIFYLSEDQTTLLQNDANDDPEYFIKRIQHMYYLDIMYIVNFILKCMESIVFYVFFIF